MKFSYMTQDDKVEYLTDTFEAQWECSNKALEHIPVWLSKYEEEYCLDDHHRILLREQISHIVKSSVSSLLY